MTVPADSVGAKRNNFIALTTFVVFPLTTPIVQAYNDRMRTLYGVAIATAVAAVTAGEPAFGDIVLDRWRSAPVAQAAALRLARSAFDSYVKGRVTIPCPTDLPPELRLRAGVFVSTMNAAGAPRCCMGTLSPMQPDIAHEIIANAVAAAGLDRRFRPITMNDLSRLRLIVSIVGPPESIGSTSALDPVRDGLVARYGDRDGVVLSGETPHPELVARWARIRAGAPEDAAVQYFRIEDVRMIEP